LTGVLVFIARPLAVIAGDNTIFHTVLFVIVVSTLAQGMTLEPFAARLGLTRPNG
jgi:NhaP-type Na+/H+ and K+/H+ antiporter